jgi:hypothetical protein
MGKQQTTDMSNNVHPEILDGLDYETQYIQKTSGASRREVKLNRGDSWLMRFLPVKFGPKKRFYARIAKHWFNGLPVVCPRHTEEAYGGSPDAYCPVCDLSDHLNADRNEELSNFGYKIKATPQWMTYCVVFQKAINGGNPQDMSLPEILQPYTFNHYKSTWEELVGFVKQNLRRSPDSVLDLEKGNDFYVSKGAKTTRLDKQDSAPIFDMDDPKWDENISKIFAACKEPVVKMPAEKKLDEFAAKAEENVTKLAGTQSRGGTAGRGRAAHGADSDDLPPDDDQASDSPAPAGRRSAPVQEEQAAPAPTRRAAAPPAEEAPAAPARRSTATAAPAAPARRAAAPAPAPEPEAEAADTRDEGPADPADEAPAEAPPEAPARRQASRPAAPRAAAAEPPPAPARRTAAAVTPAAPARPSARNGNGAAIAQESIDEEEIVPEEANDQAPPEPLVDAADDTGAGEEPPAVETPRRGASPLGTKIQNRVAAVTASARK